VATLNFPSDPTTSQTYVDSAGYIWQFDGTGWIPYTPTADGLCNVCLDQRNQWTAPQVGIYSELLSSSASIVVDFSANSHFYHTMTEDTTLAAPTGFTAGEMQSGVIEFTQHASAAKTLAFNSFWKFSGGTTPTLSTGASAKDVLIWTLGPDGTYAICNWLSNLS